MKPNDAAPFVGSVAFHPRLVAVTVGPDWVTAAFQAWLTVWPCANVHLTVQPLTASPRFVTTTSAPNPRPIGW